MRRESRPSEFEKVALESAATRHELRPGRIIAGPNTSGQKFCFAFAGDPPSQVDMGQSVAGNFPPFSA